GSSIRRRGVRTRLPEWTTGTQLTLSPGFVRNREGVSPAKAKVAGSNPVFRSNQGLGFYITGPGHTDG
ncbi:MAG TPA: hypothetical protein VK113_05770, partial [Gemmatimonadales bacterium]|nr:hypothetical protein [Gemmatimonadales bacterium]